jgi:4-alpha-glucanotransferase
VVGRLVSGAPELMGGCGGERPLARLARLFDIEPGYEDAFGAWQTVADDTLRALLAVMGCSADGERQIEARLREAEERPWRRLVAPVGTLIEGQAPEVELNLPGRQGSARLEWRLTEACGTVREGRLQLEHLPVIASRRLDGAPCRRYRWRPRLALRPGEHRLELQAGGGHAGASEAESSLIVAPRRCFAPSDLGHDRLWGLTAQLYGLRSADDWGMGSFSELARLAEQAAELGAAALGVNPLHALFPARPDHYGPYSPSSRLFLNVLYIDVTAVPEFAECAAAEAMTAAPGWRQRLAAARSANLVDYPAVAALKLPVLERLFTWFRQRHLAGDQPSARGIGFRAFTSEMGEGLRRQACFDALHEHALATGGSGSWQDWPAGLRDPESAEVERFAREHAERIEFHQYLQWLADEQLREAQERARAAGMPIGLYRDLAIGVAPNGAMTWANPGVAMVGASVGAPPDIYNPLGQNWGLAPFSPTGLRERAYRPFGDDLRHNMRHAGALRIDHAMGLMRLYWIPDGAAPAQGAYVRYPLQDLLRTVALNSARARCLVIGEDLGTVAKGFRHATARAGVLSYRLLYFERSKAGGFLGPRSYPANALISVSTHDLPTLAGFWSARDLAWRDRLELWPDGAAAAGAYADRRIGRRRLIAALKRAGLLADEFAAEEDEQLPAEVLLAAHRFLAGAPSALMMLQIEDALGEVEQANLPGTVDQHPNWRRRLPLGLDELADHPMLRELAHMLDQAGRSARGRR